MIIYGCFHSHGDAQKLLGLLRGKSESRMDENWGYPYDSGNQQMEMAQSLKHRKQMAETWPHLCFVTGWPLVFTPIRRKSMQGEMFIPKSSGWFFFHIWPIPTFVGPVTTLHWLLRYCTSNSPLFEFTSPHFVSEKNSRKRLFRMPESRFCRQ